MTGSSSSGRDAAETRPLASGSAVEELDADRLAERLVANASECFLVVDESGTVAFANPAIESIFGYEPSTVVGGPVLSLIPERLRDDHVAWFENYRRTGERTLEWTEVELAGLHRDGHEVPLSIAYRALAFDGRDYLVGLVRDVSERVDRRERLTTERAFVESVLDALPDVVYAFDEHGQFLRWNDRITEVTGYTDEEMESLDPLAFIPEEDHERVTRLIHHVIDDCAVETVESRLVTKDGTEIPYEFTGAPLVEDGEVVGLTGVGRDVAERKRREETLERLNDLNTVIRSVDRALVEGNTRDGITCAVCDRLVEEGAYRGAVVGQVGPAGEFAVDAAVGVDGAAVEPLASPAPAADRSLAERAVARRDVTAVDLTDGTVPDAWRATARDQGYGTVAAVPLVAAEETFGVLGVYSDGADGFAERERAVLAELGEGVGHAVQSALAEQLLYADVVTEVELRSTDSGVTFVAISEAADCRMELARAVSFGDDEVFYFRTSGASPSRVRAVAAERDDVATVEHLCSDDGEHLFEFGAESGTLTTVLTDHGARTTAGTADRGVARITAELPPDREVRDVVDAVTSAYPETELVARRMVDRPVETSVEFRRRLADELTDKQLAALEAAYFAGYFEWPTRTRNAQAVADSLDVAAQTFHQHLRVAQRKLLSALFESSAGGDVAR